MALTDIIFAAENSAEAARGNSGSVSDSLLARFSNALVLTGGGGTFPAVGDVDSGVTFGPNGADYTGTLVQPAVTNVLNGVQYGAGGTEFTGTATAGGGGSGVSRGRIVNA